MTSTPPTKAAVLANIDARYLAEYVCFSGQIREYVNETLGGAYRADPNPVRRSHHIISVVQLEYAAYEDAAALLMALMRFESGSTSTVLETLESYAPGDAVLGKVLDSASVTDADKLYAALGLARAIPALWSSWFPGHDLEKSLKLACRFLALDCRANQKPDGIAAYNKSKHGPLVVGSGSVLGPHLAPAPSMFFGNKKPDASRPGPVIVYGFPDDPAAIEEHERAVHFVQRSLRLIVAATLAMRYHDEVVRRFGGAEAMWNSRELVDVIDFIFEITNKR